VGQQHRPGNARHVAEQHLGFEAGRAGDGLEIGGGLLKRLPDAGYWKRAVGVELPGTSCQLQNPGIKFPVLNFQFFFLPCCHGVCTD
jgi:hypothetical protein